MSKKPKKNVEDFANEFVRRARNGEKPTVRLKRNHAESFLIMLAREGIAFARECLAEIRDPQLREIIETLFFSAAAGAVIGATLGGLAGGPPGAKVGAAVGTAVGVVVGTLGLVIRAVQEGPDTDPELVVSVA